jgi:hypothetical protein
MKEKAAVDENLLALPAGAGRAIVETGAVIACPLLGTDRFVTYCRDRGTAIDRERLIRLECLGLFAPVFRVKTTKNDTPPFYIPVRDGNNWFAKNWAMDTTGIPPAYEVPDETDQTQEGYYSIFQIDYLHILLQKFTMRVHLDSYMERGDEPYIDWQKHGERWMQYAEAGLESGRPHEYRRSLALLCQFISNRYYPKTQGDLRTIQVGGGRFSDQWIAVDGSRWDWDEYVRGWNPKKVERLFDLTPKKLRHAFETLAVAQASCDPLERWYQLIQFVSLSERKRLKGDALRAETLRAGAHMLRLLYEDLYDQELPHPNEVTGHVIRHIPELEVRQDTRRYLEFVANRFGVNPQPKLALIVEGESEEAVVRKIFSLYFGVHPGTYGIEIIVLGGVGNATGTKKDDRFRAILRLVDYLHHHQTFAFLILDNENYSQRLKGEARKAKSRHSDRRYVTRAEYIRIWKDSLEFDNFSCAEIAAAMNELAQSRARFSRDEVRACKNTQNATSVLGRLYRQKTDYDLPKVKLNEIMVDHMLSDASRRKVENRSIVKTLVRVARLAARNPLPTMYESWEKNQASKFLGKKRRKVGKGKGARSHQVSDQSRS